MQVTFVSSEGVRSQNESGSLTVQSEQPGSADDALIVGRAVAGLAG